VDVKERILAALVEERRRLGGELHDCVGGTLTGVALELSALQRKVADGQSREKLADIAQAVRRGLDEIRTFSFSLQLPWCESDESLESAIAHFATGFGRRTGLKISLDFGGPAGALATNQARILLRVLQEALLNVHRHARARSVRVSFQREGPMAALVVQDDGCGMSSFGNEPQAGAGLLSMRDQIRWAGGVVHVESTEAGTTVCAMVPVHRDNNLVGAAPADPHVYPDLKERSHSFMMVLSGDELRYEFANPAYLRLIGEQSVEGRPLLDVRPDLEPEYLAIIDQVRQTGETFVGHGMQRVLRRKDGTRTLFIDLVAHSLPDWPEAVFLEGYDVTSRVEAEQQLKLVMQELDHRAGNLLTLVQSIVNLTRGTSTQSLRQNILGRIGALAGTHQLLSQVNWSRVSCHQLVEQELRPYSLGDPRRIRLSGPPMELNSREAPALAMAFHELATNAAKYGALSTARGTVQVTWEIDGRGARLIRWQEDGGPPVKAPTRRGLGSSLLERSLDGRIGGRVHMVWREEGLVCTFELPPEEPGDRPAFPPATAPKVDEVLRSIH
jgi:two-component sensor histidine kinase